MRVQGISSAKRPIKLSSAAIDCLVRSDDPQVQGRHTACLQGNISQDGTYGWLARGGFLEVFWLRTGQRVAAWCFGALLKEPTTTITAVCECCFDKGSKLIVATSTVTSEGLICLFDVKNSTIMKAIEVPYEVTSLEVVSTISRGCSNSVVLSTELAKFCGILAVGTQCGHVYLIDLCLDDDVDGCDELSPNTLQYIDSSVKDITTKRYNALTRSKHLCVELGDEFHTRGYFNYRKPDGSPVKSFDAGEICVSALKFVPQTGLLVVGMSFGCCMLWRLQETSLEYSSRHEDDLPPVTHITYQEPENDPRNFCYLWILKGPMVSQSVESHTSIATLFQLGYGKKTWYDGFGYLFEDLSSVGPRFEHMLTSDPFNQAPFRDEGSRIISCYTVQDPNYQLPVHKSDDSFEGTCGPDISLCAIVWEAAPSDPHSKPPCYLALFDMNRWYHAQMPIELRVYGGSDVCPYFAMFSLDGIQQETGTDSIMALYIHHGTLTKFHSGIIPEPEQHFYPSSLSFDATCVTETGIVHVTYLGLQRQILSDLEERGPGAVTEPQDMYRICQHAGLLPRTAEVTPAWYKREALLTMALDHNMTAFLNSCVALWAPGEFTKVGCSLRFVLEWSWKKVAQIKEAVDQMCLTLFDWSGIHLDQQTLQVLHKHQRALESLCSVLAAISSHTTIITEQGLTELQSKQTVLSLLSEHVRLILWCYDAGLLPEHSEEEIDDDVFVYPTRALTEYYKKRRQEIQRLHSDVNSNDVLMIDAHISHSGEQLTNLWATNGGTGLYPPRSIHALLNIWLLESVKQKDKFIVMFYLLCDLLNSAPDDLQASFNEKVQRFTQTFNLPLGLSKLVQGMWLLDHKDFEDSLFYLLDPSVRKQMCPWQHTRILKALLYQGHHKLAHHYLKTRAPPLTTPEDIKLKLTILLANGLIAEAFDYQRLSRDKNNIHDLLSHVFLGCQQTKAVDQLLLLPFSGEEERHLVNYLLSSTDGQSQELLVLYYLLRCRYIEAYRLSHKVKQHAIGELDHRSRERTRVLTSLVDGYHKVLPAIQRKLCLGPEQPIQQRIGSRKEYVRPAPLSTVVNRFHVSQTVSRAKLLQSVLDKVLEVTEETPVDIEDELGPEDSPNKTDNPGPFICTPMTPRVGKISRLSEVVFAPTSHLEMGGQSLNVPAQNARAPQSPFRPRSTAAASPMVVDQSQHNNTLKRKSIMSAEALSLLMTPPIKRKSRCRDQSKVSDPQNTPQSILKISQIKPKPGTETKPSLREKPDTETKPSLREKLNFQAEGLALPTPPRLQRRVTMGTRGQDPGGLELNEVVDGMDTEVTDAMDTEAGDTMSKQLRFVGVSPDPLTSDVGAGDSPQVFSKALGRRNLRDRSPTPERKSPKMAAKTDQLPLQSGDASTSIGEKMMQGERLEESAEIQRLTSTLSAPEQSDSVELDLRSDLEPDNKQSVFTEPENKPQPDCLEPFNKEQEREPEPMDLQDMVENQIPQEMPQGMVENQTLKEIYQDKVDDQTPIEMPQDMEQNQTPQKALVDKPDIMLQEDTIIVVDDEITVNFGDKSKTIITGYGNDKQKQVVTDKNMDTDDTEPLEMSLATAANTRGLPDVISSTAQEDRSKIYTSSKVIVDTAQDVLPKATDAPVSPRTDTRSEKHAMVIPVDRNSHHTISVDKKNLTDVDLQTDADKFVLLEKDGAGVTHAINEAVDDTQDSASEDCRRRSYEEGNTEQKVTEIISDNKLTKIIETTTYKKTTTETVKVFKVFELSGESGATEEHMLALDNSAQGSSAGNDCVMIQNGYKELAGDTAEQLVDNTMDNAGQDTFQDVVSKSGTSRRSGTRAASRRGRNQAVAENQPQVTKIQRRQITKEESIPKTSKKETRGGEVASKTPTRTTRLSATLPPTPPKSTTSSPVRASADCDPPVTRSHSRSSSPAEEAAMTQIKPKPKSGRRTRTTSRSSISPGHTISSKGPLSEDSFMMKLRKTPSREVTPDRRLSTEQGKMPSREVTPKRRLSTDRKLSTDRRLSTDRITRSSVERERMSFTFSDPLSIEEAAEETFFHGTPVHSFVFSPPITRSRRRDSLKMVKNLETSLSASSSPVDGTVHNSPAKNTRLAKKREKAQKVTGLYESTSDSTINFLSPVKEEELPRGRITRQRAKGIANDEKTKTLRPRQTGIRKRKPLNW